MNTISKEIKEKVEKYLKENECAISVSWGVDSCTTFDADGKAIEDFIIASIPQESLMMAE